MNKKQEKGSGEAGKATLRDRIRKAAEGLKDKSEGRRT